MVIRYIGKPTAEIKEAVNKNVKRLDIKFPDIRCYAFGNFEDYVRKTGQLIGKDSALANIMSSGSNYPAAGYMPRRKNKLGLPVLYFNEWRIQEILKEERKFGTGVLHNVTHESLHMKADEVGWADTEHAAFGLAWPSFSSGFKRYGEETLHTLTALIQKGVGEFLKDELGCRFGLSEFVFEDRASRVETPGATHEKLLKWFKDAPSTKPIELAVQVIALGKTLILPPSFPNREQGEARLVALYDFEEVLNPQFLKLYQEARSAFRGLNFDPEIDDILDIYQRMIRATVECLGA